MNYDQFSNYSSMNQSYPNPFTTNQGYVNERSNYDANPSDRTSIGLKVIEDIPDDGHMKRSVMNETHSYPMFSNPSVSQFSQSIRRQGDKVSEILGTKQNTNKFNEVDFSKIKGPNYYHTYMDKIQNDSLNNISQQQILTGQNYNNSSYLENTQVLGINQSNSLYNQYSQNDQYEQSKQYHEQKQNYSQQQPIRQMKPYGSSEQQSCSLERPKMKILDSSLFEKVPEYTANQDTYGERERKNSVYQAINEYFKNFVLTKTAIHGEYSVYKAIVECLICTGVRYIVAIVKNDSNPVTSKKPLHTLHWVSFQTRLAEDEGEMQQFGVDAFTQNRPQESVLDDIIRLNRKTGKSYIYNCDNLPLQVEILQQEDEDDLAELGKVSLALELYSTILTFIE